MRGDRERQANIMLAVTAEAFVPDDHPLRRIKPLVDSCLARLSPRFEEMYAKRGRPSIPPEHLLKGSLLIALFSVRSERQFCEQLRYNLLFKWFLDLNVEDEPFNATTFSKNRERLLEAEVARAFFSEVVGEAGRRRLLSDPLQRGRAAAGGVGLAQERPSAGRAGAALVERWAQRGGGLPGPASQPRDARVTHRRRGAALPQGSAAGGEAELSGPCPQREPARAGGGRGAERGNGYGEREAALQMLERSVRGRATLGADRGYDTRDFVAAVRARGVTPHVARNERGRRSAIDGRTTRHAGYGRSLRRRKLVEEVFGWLKTVGGGRKLRYRGRRRNRAWLELTAAAYNLVRLSRLEPVAA